MLKTLLSDFVALLVPYKEGEEEHSWGLITGVLVFLAVMAGVCTMAGMG